MYLSIYLYYILSLYTNNTHMYVAASWRHKQYEYKVILTSSAYKKHKPRKGACVNVWVSVLRKVNAYAARRQKKFYCLLLSVLSLYFSSERVAFAFIYHFTFIRYYGWAELSWDILWKCIGTYFAILSYIEEKMEININRRTRDIMAFHMYIQCCKLWLLYVITFLFGFTRNIAKSF